MKQLKKILTSPAFADKTTCIVSVEEEECCVESAMYGSIYSLFCAGFGWSRETEISGGHPYPSISTSARTGVCVCV